MSRKKCRRCGKLAHVTVGRKYYCLKCAPKPTIPVVIEEPKPWPDIEPLNDGYLPVQTPKKESWWKRWFGF